MSLQICRWKVPSFSKVCSRSSTSILLVHNRLLMALQKKAVFRPFYRMCEISHSLSDKKLLTVVLCFSSRMSSNGPQGDAVLLTIKGCFCLHVITVTILSNVVIFDIFKMPQVGVFYSIASPLFIFEMYIKFPSFRYMIITGREPELWPEMLNVPGWLNDGGWGCGERVLAGQTPDYNPVTERDETSPSPQPWSENVERAHNRPEISHEQQSQCL